MIESELEKSAIIKEMEQIEVEKVVFEKINIEYKNKLDFSENHYFDDYEKGIINGNLKDILHTIFKTITTKELLTKLVGEWTIIFSESDGINEVDINDKKVIVYQKSAEKIVELNKKKKKVKAIINKLYNPRHDKQMTSNDAVEMLKVTSQICAKVNLTPSHKKYFMELIPQMIKDGEIKLKQEHISEMNKKQIDEIVELGFSILERKQGTEKKLGITTEQLKNEIAWQKYFEKYGDYLLFGSIDITEKVEGEVKVAKEFTQRPKDSYYDIITLNKYGFIDIVELKKSDFNLFRYDKSHDTFYTSPDLSKAIYQLLNYLMLMPSAYSKEKEIVVNGKVQKVRDPLKGTESAKGLLIIGSTKTLLSKTDEKRALEDKNIEKFELDRQLKLHLREVNYSLSHIEIITYDELLDNLKNFSEKLKIEIYNK